jgi:hypothetical protein
MAEAVEFDIPDAGAPRLDGQDAPDVSQGPDPHAQLPLPLMPVPGWTQEEASRVVGGAIANVTLLMYAVRWHEAPAPELWPVIAGDPEREFPLMGAGLAPVLDFIAPKGSPQAVGVSLTAGVGEVIGAMARRWPVVNTAPPKARAAPAPAAAPAAAAGASEGQGFKFTGDQLRVLERADEGLAAMGIE